MHPKHTEPNKHARDNRRGGIDPAALAAAAVASAIATIGPAGPYTPVGTIIGITIMLLIFGYDVDPDRTPRQSLAFGAITALIGVLVLGYPMEVIFDPDILGGLAVLGHEHKDEIPYSNVPLAATIVVWLVLTGFFYRRDRRRNA
ncbi:membrane hypothetical protein [Paraburkholderia unamae]|uniref:hypothetical protein n=1 Tax=Paraburkholderia unamae TaxID=219649 RepID=UPI001CAC4DD6|nr:hypothetical protein [Paraburkholderia unamae]CAG9268277.1 membrane hypothetical protein [Paraburkholderia unamae]